MATPQETNADQLAFWNGAGGAVWVERQAHTDAVLVDVSKALIRHAAPQKGEAVLDVGCGCGASTIDVAKAVGPLGRVAGHDISGPMLAEAARRAEAAGVANVDWRLADPAQAALDPYDLLISNFGVMFFGDPVAAFSHMHKAAKPGARMAFVCWRGLTENPWMGVPMAAVAKHLPPRPAADPEAPGMFAFADPDRVTRILAAAGWQAVRFTALDLELDIAAGKGLEVAVVQSTRIGAVNSWLRNQPAEIVTAAVVSLRDALAPHAAGDHVRLPGAMWLVSANS